VNKVGAFIPVSSDTATLLLRPTTAQGGVETSADCGSHARSGHGRGKRRVPSAAPSSRQPAAMRRPALLRAGRRRIGGVCQREPGQFTEVLRIKVLRSSHSAGPTPMSVPSGDRCLWTSARLLSLPHNTDRRCSLARRLLTDLTGGERGRGHPRRRGVGWGRAARGGGSGGAIPPVAEGPEDAPHTRRGAQTSRAWE
jgi:hypothetical protein